MTFTFAGACFISDLLLLLQNHMSKHGWTVPVSSLTRSLSSISILSHTLKPAREHTPICDILMSYHR